MRRLRLMRRSRTEIVAVLVLLLLASFSFACMGGDTQEVQKPINETSNRYQQFLGEIGVSGLGGVPQPWIVSPEDGDEPSLPVEVRGWSALAKDVAVANAADSARVRVYVVPRQIVDQGSFSLDDYEISGTDRTAAVSEDTREWSLALEASDFAPGLNVVYARTEIGRGALQSRLTSIEINVPDGTGPEVRTANGVAPEETMHLVCVMACPTGFEFADNDEQLLRDLVDETAAYWQHISHGNVAVGSVTWLTNDGDGYAVSAWGDEFINNAGYLQEVMSIPGVTAAVAGASAGPVTVISFVPEHADQTTDYAGFSNSWSTMDQEAVPAMSGTGLEARRGSLIHIPILKTPVVAGLTKRTTGVILHEIAHGLGGDRHADSLPAGAASLPDLYPVSDPVAAARYYGVSQYSNLNQESANYFLMAEPEAGNTLCGYSQWWLEWVEWDEHDLAGDSETFSVPTLSQGDTPSVSVPRFSWQEQDGRDAYIILEGRSLQQEYDRKYDGRWSGDGVIVYEIKERTGNENAVRPGWPRSVNYLARLDQEDPIWSNPAKMYAFVLEGNFSSSADSNDVTYVSLAAVEGLLSDIPVTSGAILSPSLSSLSSLESTAVASSGDEVSSDATFTVVPQPDLDLHAYLPDGTHIGMNYETGEYEQPVDGAVVSGDMAMGDEWILLPEDLAATVRFEISSYDTRVYAESTPENAAADLTIDYEIVPAAYSDVAASVVKGEAETGSLAPGEVSSTEMEGDVRDPELTPITSGTPSGLSTVSSLVWELGGAGLLFVLGVMIITLPHRRR